MWFNIFKFELSYRKGRPATYLYFGILFLLAFLAVTTDAVQIGGSAGKIKENAPFVITQMQLILCSLVGMLMASAIMGVAVVRDFEYRTEALFFTAPIRKIDYLLGRYLGSMVVLLFVLLGGTLGFLLGDFMPWREADKLLPFSAATFFQPFFVFVVTNALIAGSIFFAVGALSRRMVVVFSQGMVLLMGYLIGNSLLSDLENKEIAALIDPFGIRTFSFVTEYWTVTEKNGTLPTLTGMILYNRLIWMGVAFGLLVVAYFGFNFRQVQNGLVRRKKLADEHKANSKAHETLPLVRLHTGFVTSILQAIKLSGFYYRTIVKDVAFVAIALGGILLFLVNAFNMDGFYDTPLYPTTYSMAELIAGSFGLFFFILILLFSGELVWKERQVNIHLIYDALPMPSAVPMVAKMIALSLTLLTLLAVLMLLSIGIQAGKGYFLFELNVYASVLLWDTFIGFLIYILLGFFVHVMVNNKFMGHAVMIVFFIAMTALPELGVEHRMFLFNTASLGSYSDMNTTGHFVTPFSWFSVYWAALSSLLFALGVLLAVRGSEELLKFRVQLGKLQLTKPALTFFLLLLVTFVSSGSFIYYNTNIRNEYRNSKETEALQAEYEKTLKQYEFLPQPRITGVEVKVEIFPERRAFEAIGHYILKNKTGNPIPEIHIQEASDRQLSYRALQFDRPAEWDSTHRKFGYRIYRLATPLQPGESLRMDFHLDFTTIGFVASGSNTDVVHNGTFFNNQYFPSLGYNGGFEIGSDDTRKEQGLPEKERMMERNDPRGLRMGLFGDDADVIDFQIVLGTSPDQIAIAPGYLQKEWEENGRKYFEYKMDVPMCNFFSIVSARYAVKKEVYKGVSLEIYHHPTHAYNLDRMMEGMKQSLDYYQANFSPYQFRQVRIMEFPRYASFAQSFANTIPFSESIGFIMNVKSEDDLDMPFYVTAHEVAHQWWGHQVTEAQVKGNAMLSETLSQYSALMVMKQRFPREYMQKFLKHELDRYLRGRSSETKKEQPLELVEGQGYIHYNKGSLVMFALQDYVGEDSVNAALRRFIRDWNVEKVDSTGIYPTSADLVGYYRSITPDSLQYLITDLFEKITLYENKAEKATFTANGSQYTVSLDLSTQKVYADSLGNETDTPMNDWVYVGVYGEKKEGEKQEKLIYYQKHRITAGKSTITVTVPEKPARAGIDPLNLLIDRHPDDNVVAVAENEI